VGDVLHLHSEDLQWLEVYGQLYGKVCDLTLTLDLALPEVVDGRLLRLHILTRLLHFQICNEMNSFQSQVKTHVFTEFGRFDVPLEHLIAS